MLKMSKPFQDQLHQAERTTSEHMHLDNATDEFDKWLKDARENLEHYDDVTGDRQQVTDNLHKLQVSFVCFENFVSCQMYSLFLC